MTRRGGGSVARRLAKAVIRRRFKEAVIGRRFKEAMTQRRLVEAMKLNAMSNGHTSKIIWATPTIQTNQITNLII